LISGRQVSSEESIQELVNCANDDLNNEAIRTQGGFGGFSNPDSNIPNQTCLQDCDLNILKKNPQLAGFSDAFIKQISASDYLRLIEHQTKTETSKSSRETLDERMTSNKDKLGQDYEKEFDDGNTNLCKARFSSAPICSNQTLFQLARKNLPFKGLDPVSCYDLGSVGLGGNCTMKGWSEVHNPGSSNLVLKHFNVRNAENSHSGGSKVSLIDGGESLEIGDPMKEISGMPEFKLALRTMNAAMKRAQPWNYSIEALVHFLENTNYLERDITSGNQASVLTKFVNYILGANAHRWRTETPFFTTRELGQEWGTWRGTTAISAPLPVNHSYIREQKFHNKGSFLKPSNIQHKETRKQPFSDLCIRYNTGRCPNQADSSCQLRTKEGKSVNLRHLCNKIVNGKTCNRNHSALHHR